MALTAGNTIPGSTTLAAYLDLVFANRVNLPSGSAVFTALDSTRCVITWPGVGNGDNLIYLTPNPKQMPSATIAV